MKQNIFGVQEIQSNRPERWDSMVGEVKEAMVSHDKRHQTALSYYVFDGATTQDCRTRSVRLGLLLGVLR